VAALEAAAIYAVVTGLIVDIVPREKPGHLIANEFPLPEPSPIPSPPSKPHDPVVRDPKLLHADKPFVALFPPAGTIITGPGPIALPSPEPVDLTPIPRPSPSRGYAPRFAKPRNSPSGWATTADYPGSDLRQGNQGLVRFSLTVGADGKVSACVVVKSSGFPGLDEATCGNVARRARFEPATDASGAKVTGSYAGSVRWVIPE
jgi:protein TonB